MIGNRKAFKQAVIAYLCIGGILGAGLAVYSTRWGREINEIIVLSILGIYAGGSLIAIFLTWQRIKKGEPFKATYLHSLLPERLRKWMISESDEDSDY